MSGTYLKTLNSARHGVLIALLVLLTACGGGSSTNLPPRSVDNIAPFVASFSPVGDSIAISRVISVSFSESIVSISSKNISITEFDSTAQNARNLVLPDSVLDLNSNADTTVLDVNLANASSTSNNTLLANKIYLVQVSGVADANGNTMVGTCAWYFATQNAVVDPLLAASVKCVTQAVIASSNWDSLIWDQDNWD